MRTWHLVSINLSTPTKLSVPSSVEGKILRKNFSVNSTCAGYPLPNSLAQRKPRNIKNKIPFIAQSKKTSVPAANLTLTSVEGGGCGSIMQRETNRTQSARGNARLVIHLSAYHHTRPFT